MVILRVASPLPCKTRTRVKRNIDYSSGSLQYNVSFIRLVHDREVDVLASFYTLLYSHKKRREGEDERFGGFHLAKGSLTLDHSIRSLPIKMLSIFLGRVFGG
jgi:hypothetical protein